ncbi:MAG: lysostaphin resistance A-like protein [Halobacteriales archaeon]
MPATSTPQWDLFAALTVFVLGTLLVLARASEQAIRGTEPTPDTDQERWEWDRNRPPSVEGTATESDRQPEPTSRGDSTTTTDVGDRNGDERQATAIDAMSARQLLANVVLSHGLLAGVVIGGAWITEIPAAALGLLAPIDRVVVIGGALGIGLYIANEIGTQLADRFDIGYDERLREALAPEEPSDWGLLLLVVLPVIAGFEELLFRGAVIGVFNMAYGVDPWILAVVSSGLFGYGHGAQGHSGIAVTAGLGFVLATAFILTESLLVVIVAHYLVNALEFLVHER